MSYLTACVTVPSNSPTLPSLLNTPLSASERSSAAGNLPSAWDGREDRRTPGGGERLICSAGQGVIQEGSLWRSLPVVTPLSSGVSAHSCWQSGVQSLKPWHQTHTVHEVCVHIHTYWTLKGYPLPHTHTHTGHLRPLTWRGASYVIIIIPTEADFPLRECFPCRDAEVNNTRLKQKNK